MLCETVSVCLALLRKGASGLRQVARAYADEARPARYTNWTDFRMSSSVFLKLSQVIFSESFIWFATIYLSALWAIYFNFVSVVSHASVCYFLFRIIYVLHAKNSKLKYISSNTDQKSSLFLVMLFDAMLIVIVSCMYRFCACQRTQQDHVCASSWLHKIYQNLLIPRKLLLQISVTTSTHCCLRSYFFAHAARCRVWIP